MLDSDLAKLYQVETKHINEAVKNSKNKFPDVLTNEELENLRSKFSTSNLTTHGGRRYVLIDDSDICSLLIDKISKI